MIHNLIHENKKLMFDLKFFNRIPSKELIGNNYTVCVAMLIYAGIGIV